MFVDRPGEWLADRVARQARRRLRPRLRDDGARLPRARGRRRARRRGTSQFDHARAVKSELELESVRDSVRINTEGFWIFLEHFAPGKTEREILAPCEQLLRRAGLRPADDGHGARPAPNGGALPEFKIAGDYRIAATDMVLPSLEVAGAGGHWVEVSRAICPGEPNDETKQMMDAYDEYYDGRARCAARRRDRARRPPRRLEGLPRPRLQARPRHRPLDRDDDDRVPEDRRRRRDGAARQAWCSRCTRTRSRRTASRASTCRTRGSSPPTAACRSRACRCGSSTGAEAGR